MALLWYHKELLFYSLQAEKNVKYEEKKIAIANLALCFRHICKKADWLWSAGMHWTQIRVEFGKMDVRDFSGEISST